MEVYQRHTFLMLHMFQFLYSYMLQSISYFCYVIPSRMVLRYSLPDRRKPRIEAPRGVGGAVPLPTREGCGEGHALYLNRIAQL